MEEVKKKYKLTLKAIRVNMGKTQDEFGKLLGVSGDVISNWENAKTYPNVKDLPKIEEVTGLSYNDINFLPDSENDE